MKCKIPPFTKRASALAAVLLTMTPLSRAQSVHIVAQPVRVTVPVNSTTSSDVDYTATLDSNVVSAVHLALSGLPSGADGTFSVNDFSVTTNGTLTLGTTNIPDGIYPFNIDASGGATRSLTLDLQSAHIWSGATFTNGGTASFSDAGNWVNGDVAGPNSDVVLTDDGALGHGDTTANILISSDTEIGSLRQAITSGGTRRDNIQIDPGAALKITGTNGLSLGLRDHSDTYQSWEFAVTGDQGTLVVSNANADLNTFAIENQTPLLDLSGLGTLVVDARQIHFDDFRAYPNYDSMAANGYTDAALPRRMPVPEVRWARTNIVHLNFAGDPDNWTNSGSHEYSMMVGNDSGRGGSTQRHLFRFGISNLFEMNSVCFAGSGVTMDQSGRGEAVFNSDFASDDPIAIFRGPSGMDDRMAVFAEADNSGPGSSGSSTKAIVNFTSGTVDALVDRLYLGIDRTNANGGYARGELDIGAGTFDVNQAVLGYQNAGNNLNSGGEDYCQGVLVVNDGGTFIAHDSIDLGWTTADATNNSGAAGAGYGQITVNNGGTLIANTIGVGGVTKLSSGNTITINGGTLVVSNTIAGSDKMLDSLSMSDGTLTLFVDGSQSNPYVYATNLLTGGSFNIINIASLTGVSSYPKQIPLIAYGAASPNFSVTLPSGLYGYILNNTANSTIDMVVDTNPPASIAWSGTQDGNWDHTTKNWNGGTDAFVDGDFVTFDDTATGPTDINVTETVIPGQSATTAGVTVTNSNKAYTISGTGTIGGTGKMLKEGSGTLTLDVTAKSPVDVTEGTVNGSGTIGITTVGSGAVLDFSGTIGGLTSSGTSSSSGMINGPVTINAGTFYNSGTVTTAPGYLTVGDGSIITNASGGVINVDGGAWTIGTGTVVANFGEIDNDANRLTINGGATYYGTGAIYDATGDVNENNGRVVLNSGAVLGIGDSVSNSIGSMTIGARLDLNQGSRTVFDIDMNNPATNDVIVSDKLSNIRGTIVMNNIGSVPFAVGQTFHLFDFQGFPNTPETAHLDYTFDPPTPGYGMQWVAGDDFITNGIVSIAAAPVTSPPITTTVSGDSITLTWPSGATGFQLQVQTNDLSTGISTNWYDVPNSDQTNSATVTIDPASPSVFYRLIQAQP